MSYLGRASNDYVCEPASKELSIRVVVVKKSTGQRPIYSKAIYNEVIYSEAIYHLQALRADLSPLPAPAIRY